MNRTLILAALSGLAMLTAASPVLAADETQERVAAIGACRTAIAEKVGVPATTTAIDFRRSETKSRSFELRYSVRDNGASLGNATCVYQRRAGTVEVTLDQSLLARAGATPIASAN